MRLHRLHLQAFGPFAEPQEIDFERVGASGLFLLEGPTGAGKTSILDAVTFALYGGLSGRDSGSDRQHSHFAGAGVEPSVELEFSVRGVRHRIRRTPEWNRPKKRSTGITRQASNVHFERREGAGWRSLSSGKAEVGDLVTELIGLNRDQFTQVVVLPQGEFAQFLRAGDDERRVLLTKIFGTGLYDEITAEFARRRTVVQKTVELARSRHANRVAAAAEAAGLPTDEREAWVAAPDADHLARLMEVQAGLSDADVMARERVGALTEPVGHAVATRERALRLVELAGRRRSAELALSEHHRGVPQYEAALEQLTQARRVSAVRPLIVLMDEAATGWGEIGRLVQALAPQAPELLEGADGTELTAAAAQLERTAHALAPALALEECLPELRDRLTAAELAADAATKRLDQLRDRQVELPALVVQARARLAAAREATAHLREYKERVETLAARAAAARDVLELIPRLDALGAQRSAAIEAHQRTVDEHQHRYELRLLGMAAELAGELRPRRPCAVCGSKTHPLPAQPMLDATSAEEVEAALATRREAESWRESIEDRWSEINERVAVARTQAGEVPLPALIVQLADSRAALTEAREQAATLTEAEATLTEREVELQLLQRSLEDSAAQLAQALARASGLTAEVAAADVAVAVAADGARTVRLRQLELTQEAALAAQLARAVAELERGRRDHRAASDRARTAAVESGFDSVDAVRAVMLAEPDLDALDTAVTGWRRTDDRLRAAADPEHFDGVDAAHCDEYAVAASAAAQELVRIQTDFVLAQTTAATAQRTLERFGQRVADVHASAEAVQVATDAAGDVLYLADLTRGMDGHLRMNLTTYVLRRWFERVVAAANTRLGSMSSGRYALVRTDVGARSSERSGLTLRVIDQHTGEERSTASMSGGETFYTSLALALGLADVVSAEAGGVELDTLFIDEGFGSLDAETLDQVMAVIDELRDHGRTIGIVSHVADLKDRVQERIEVYRRRDGSSATRVVA